MMRLSRRTLGIGLVVSLAVNLFVAGYLVASAVNHGWRDHRGPPDRRLALRSAFRTLDGEARERAERQWRERFPEIREKLRAVRSARREFRDAVRADTVDLDAVDRAFQKMHAARGAAQETIHRAVREIGEGLSAAERQEFYKAIFERRGKRRHRRRRDRD